MLIQRGRMPAFLPLVGGAPKDPLTRSHTHPRGLLELPLNGQQENRNLSSYILLTERPTTITHQVGWLRFIITPRLLLLPLSTAATHSFSYFFFATGGRYKSKHSSQHPYIFSRHRHFYSKHKPTGCSLVFLSTVTHHF